MAQPAAMGQVRPFCSVKSHPVWHPSSERLACVWHVYGIRPDTECGALGVRQGIGSELSGSKAQGAEFAKLGRCAKAAIGQKCCERLV